MQYLEYVPKEHWALVQEHLGLCISVAKKYGKARWPELLSDACIPAFLAAAERYDPGRGALFSSYATTTMHGACAAWFRAGRRRENMHERVSRFIVQSAPDEGLKQLEDRDRVQWIMKGLSTYDVNLLFLRYVHDLDLQEIADEIGVHKTTVMRQINKALDRAARR